MYDRDELHLELSLHITGNVFNSGSDGVSGCEQRVHDNVKVFYLEVCLIQGFKRAPIIEVIVEWYSKVRIHEGSDGGRVFGGGQE